MFCVSLFINLLGGEGGIRTRGTLSGTDDFQSPSFGRSDTSPFSRFTSVCSHIIPRNTSLQYNSNRIGIENIVLKTAYDTAYTSCTSL
jgi:hypothetical protein